MIIIRCSGMFRNVPCSWFYRRPKIQPNAWGNYWILYHKTNKETSTVLCSVVKHLGSGSALKKWGKTLDFVSCFPLHLFRALPLPACFTTEQSTVEASLFVK